MSKISQKVKIYTLSSVLITALLGCQAQIGLDDNSTTVDQAQNDKTAKTQPTKDTTPSLSKKIYKTLPLIEPNQSFSLPIDAKNSHFIGRIQYKGDKLTSSKIVSGNESGAFKLVPVAPNYNKLRYIYPNRAKAGVYNLKVVFINKDGSSKPQNIKITLTDNSVKPKPDPKPDPKPKPKPSKDNIPPTIKLKGAKNITITQYETFIDPGATVSDNIDKNLQIKKQGSVNTSKVGKYTISYSATDSSGNSTTTRRTITITKAISVNGKVIYVDGVGGDGVKNGGKDSNSGTSLKEPLRTIAKANQIAKPGDLILIRGGTYNEPIIPSRSGTKNNEIIYRGYNGELPKIETKNPIRINNRSYIIVDGFKLYTSLDTYRAAVRFDGQHNKLYNSQIINPTVIANNPENRQDYIKTNFPEFGLVVAKSKFNTLQNNIVSGWRQGLGAGGATNLIVKENIIAGNIHTEIDIGPRPSKTKVNDYELLSQLYEGNIIGASLTSDGIQTESATPGVVNIRGIVIRDNIFYFNSENALDFKSGGDIVVENNTFVATLGDNDGMGVRKTSTGMTIERGDAISIGSDRKSERVIIRKNVFYDNSAATGTKGDDWKVYNNTIVANNRDANGYDSDFDVNPAGVIPKQSVPQSFLGITVGGNDNIVVLNNIVVDQKHALLKLGHSGGGKKRIDHNLYANVYGGINFVIGRNASAQSKNFTQWRSYLNNTSSIVGNDQNSFIADPKFINVPRVAEAGFPYFNFKQDDPVNPVYIPVLKFSDIASKFPYNFHLKSNSPAIDAGGDLTKATNSANNSKTLKVQDAALFFDGYSIAGEKGDLIKIGNSAPVRISKINYATNTITLSETRSWSKNDSVNLNYKGSAPDIGAFEYGM